MGAVPILTVSAGAKNASAENALTKRAGLSVCLSVCQGPIHDLFLLVKRCSGNLHLVYKKSGCSYTDVQYITKQFICQATTLFAFMCGPEYPRTGNTHHNTIKSNKKEARSFLFV